MTSKADLDALLLDRMVEEKLEQLRVSGELASLFPEVHALVGFGGGDTGHKDLWDHTKRVVAQCVPLIHLRWAALFHDIGKVHCLIRNEKGEIAFHGHESVSASLFRDIARRTKFWTREEVETIRFLIYNLGHVEAYDSGWADSAVRRFHKLAGEHFDGLLALSRADITTKHQAKRERFLRQIHELKTRALELARIDAIPAALPSGLGIELTKAFGIPPSPALGQLMKALKDSVEAGELPRQASVDDILKFVRERNLA